VYRALFFLLFILIVGLSVNKQIPMYGTDTAPLVRGEWRSAWDINQNIELAKICEGYPYNNDSIVNKDTLSVVRVTSLSAPPVIKVKHINDWCAGWYSHQRIFQGG